MRIIKRVSIVFCISLLLIICLTGKVKASQLNTEVEENDRTEIDLENSLVIDIKFNSRKNSNENLIQESKENPNKSTNNIITLKDIETEKNNYNKDNIQAKIVKVEKGASIKKYDEINTEADSKNWLILCFVVALMVVIFYIK